MTKVKTILAEFCSPKDILAINRLGLLKKDERESQPIPWRHRLNNRERRELVRSELRMSVRPKSHRSRNDHTRAINSAKCPKDSKMGECLISGYSKSSTALDPWVGRINNEQRRAESRLQQTKKNFLRTSQCLNHEPLILVERPVTPKVRSRASFMKKHGIDPAVVEVPRYMRPTQSRARTPSTLTTIEAFTADVKRKKNLWEEATDHGNSDLKFKSTYRSCARLTDTEIKMLRIGHSLHKPTEESICRDVKPSDDNNIDEKTDGRNASSSSSPPPPICVSGKSKTPPNPTSLSARNVGEEMPQNNENRRSVFITQLPDRGFPNRQTQINNLKSVTFSDLSKTEEKRIRRSDSVKEIIKAEKKGRELVRQKGKQEPQTVYEGGASASVSKKDKSLLTRSDPSPGLRKHSSSKSFLSVILKE